MSQYRTISSDYRVLKVDHNDKIIEQIFANNPLYRVALMEMVKDFNNMHLEHFIDDKESIKVLGYTIKEKIKSITMELLNRQDKEGNPYIRITIESFPRKLRMTSKVRSFLDDYISSQFCDGWGEGFFYPNNVIKTSNGEYLAIE